MSTHISISHGGDFFGEDRFSIRQLRELGQYARGILPADDQGPLIRVLDDAGEREHHIEADQAALLAVLLRRMASSRFLKRTYVDVAVRLGQAAALAAGEGTPWTWTPTQEGQR